MQTFIERLAEHLMKTYPEKISELCIVFPNRRAGLFFKTALARLTNKPLWSPEVFSIEDFIIKLSQSELLDPIAQLFELYSVYKEIEKEEFENFEEFSKWGQILLSDFNDIDSYLVDSKSLFSNLKNLKELESWSLNADNLTTFQKEYLHFWESLGNYYHAYTSRLSRNKQATQGMAYRISSENVNEKVNNHSWHKIIFAGFNALNAAEEKIIRELVKAGIAECFWDSDAYYLDNKIQEAGRFLRKHRATGLYSGYPGNEFNWVRDSLTTGKKEITITGVSKNIGQAKLSGQIVRELLMTDPKTDLTQTAIVLADENLLLPVLHSLPDELGNVNVTMGYPLHNTPLAGFIELIFQLHENETLFGKNRLYSRDVLKLLYHPYTKMLLDNTDEPFTQKLISYLLENNSIFCNLKAIEHISTKDVPAARRRLTILFAGWKDVNSIFTCLSALLETLKQELTERWEQTHSSESNQTNIELEYVFAFSKIIKRIKSISSGYPWIDSAKIFQGLLNQLLRTTNLSFYGEPVMGLQVMGMLETRVLEFGNVILLSANEGVLPSGKNQHSFIPQDIKRIFGLPTNSEKDAIFAYHFYRLIQNAQNIQILYNTEAGNLGGGEKSRFLTQLLHEFPKLNTKSSIRHQVLEVAIEPHPDESIIQIPKTEDLLGLIRQKSESGFSPSLLNIYRNCTLKFYFHLIAGLRESDEIEETIGADTFGNVLHKTLEILYKPYKGIPLTLENLKAIRLLAETTLTENFEDYYASEDLNYGKNLLTLKVALKYLQKFFDKEQAILQKLNEQGEELIIQELEKEFVSTITIKKVPIKTKGIIDRIEMISGATRIIDYKTGKAEDKELHVKDFGLLLHDQTLNKSFQLLMYAWLYAKNTKSAEPIRSGIISLRQIGAGLKTVKINKEDILSAKVLEEFEGILSTILKEMLDPSLPFIKTSDKKTCEYCPFRIICNR